MYMHMTMLVVFAAVTAAMWLMHGFWSNIVAAVNLVAAMLITIGFAPPLVIWLAREEMVDAEIGFYLVFAIFWVMFAIAYNILRLLTDSASKRKIEFPPLFELIGRSVMAPINGLLIVTFLCATMLIHSPLPGTPFAGAWPPSFLGIRTHELLAKAFATASKGALSTDNEFDDLGGFGR